MRALLPRSVAVIIVSYRCASWTIACLQALSGERADDRIALRVVVVDNASGDTADIGSAIAQAGWSDWVTLVEAPRNGGFAYGNNLGFAHALAHGNPDYLHLLNPDTRVRPGAVHALVDFLDRHPEVGIAGSSFENGDGSDWPIAFRFPSALSEIEEGLGLGLVSRLLRPWVVARVMSAKAQPTDWGAGASMMVRRSVVEAIGGLDENYFLYFEETEFCWRARRAGFAFWYVPQSRVVHIAGQSTKVTERNARPKRLPDYWFASRRRYFASTCGMPAAVAIDLIALAAHALGRAKQTALGRSDQLVPRFLGDLWQHSIVHRRNRTLADRRTNLARNP
jgi:GT2 family glycosyltransferase